MKFTIVFDLSPNTGEFDFKYLYKNGVDFELR